MSGLISVVGAAMTGKAEQTAYNANATAQQQQGEITREQSFSTAAQTWDNVQRRLGAARAAYGAAGVDPNTGSPLLVVADSARQGELARQATLFQGLAGQQTADTQAAIERFQGKAAAQAGLIKAGTTLLTSAVKIAGANTPPGTIPSWISW